MQATTVTSLAGGKGRSPLSNDPAQAALFSSSSSVTLIACFPSPKPNQICWN